MQWGLMVMIVRLRAVQNIIHEEDVDFCKKEIHSMVFTGEIMVITCSSECFAGTSHATRDNASLPLITVPHLNRIISKTLLVSVYFHQTNMND